MIYIHSVFVVDLGAFEWFGPERLNLAIPKLRAVGPGEQPQRKLTVTEAASLNDHREMLVALRNRVAKSVEAADCPPVALAALSRQLTLISKELSVLDSGGEEDVIAQAVKTPDEAWDAV